MEDEPSYLLEINLISAQDLKPAAAAANLRGRMHTYALAYVDPAAKLRTRVDRVGGENPTWNDKFIFRVSPAFLASETSAVSVEIYSVGYLRDPLVGSVRFLLRSCLQESAESTESVGSSQIGRIGSGIGGIGGIGVPYFAALQIRRPSGRFQGVLNIGAMVISAADTSFLTGISPDISAIGYQDLMGEPPAAAAARKKVKTRRRKKSNDENENHHQHQHHHQRHLSTTSSMDTGEFSDSNSSCSSMSSTTSTAFMDWNGGGRREQLRSDGSSGYLCGLGFQRKDSSESVRSEVAD